MSEHFALKTIVAIYNLFSIYFPKNEYFHYLVAAFMKNGFNNTNLSSFLYDMPIGIYTCNANGKITYYNPEAANIWGYSPQLDDPHGIYFSGARKLFLKDGSDLPHEYSYMARAIRSGQRFKNIEVGLEQPGGTKVAVLININPLFKQQRLYGVIATVQDITSHKKAEEDAWRLAALVDSSSDAIISKTLDGTIQSWNHAAQKMFGYSEQEAIGRDIRMLIPPAIQEEEDLIIDKIKRGGKIRSFETIRVMKSGKKRPVSLTISPIKNENGSIIGSSKIARDISKQMETRKKLEQAAKLKDNFIAMVSHELKTPLAILKTYLQYMETQLPAGDQQLIFLRKALDQEERLAGIVTNLIDISKIEADKFSIKLTRFNIHHFLNECVENTRLVHKRAQIDCTFDLPEKTTITADRIRLSQVLSNLLSNALKFTPNKTPITLKSALTDGNFYFSVANMGPLIAKEDQEKIFDLFYRVQQMQLYQGLGIGLYLCKQIILNHKGKIWVTSARAKGTAFHIKVPLDLGKAELKVNHHEEETENTSGGR